mmetsp:Transcript_20951/g.62497  ORF Transcript_20951/g.62497 Transcript_20951/m.62497 type:complete len:195 (+) Transcript_20951:159-743(+)
MIRRHMLALALAVGAGAYLAPSTRRALGPRPSRTFRRGAALMESETTDDDGPPPIELGAAFDVKQYPLNTDEFVDSYRRWNAAKGVDVSPDDARRDIQAFMTQEPLMEKWRPILQAEAEEANKMTFVDYVNAFTNLALPIAVGFTFLPLLRGLGEQIPVINDVILPKIDQGLELVKTGGKKLVELPICLEFGDC